MSAPSPVLLWCPRCDLQHVDRGVWSTRPHRIHLCARCGLEWRPFKVSTVGVKKFKTMRSLIGRRARAPHVITRRDGYTIAEGRVLIVSGSWRGGLCLNELTSTVCPGDVSCGFTGSCRKGETHVIGKTVIRGVRLHEVEILP